MLPIFLINLDRDPDRLAFMQAQFDALELEVERLPAIDGRRAIAEGSHAAARWSALTAGEVGCFESHCAFWRVVVERKLPAAMVLEDDVALASDLSGINPTQDVLDRADILKIDHFTSFSPMGSEIIPVAPGRVARRLLGREYCTAGYVVTQAGAQKLLARARRYFLPVDWYMFHPGASPIFSDLRTWKLAPSAVVQMRYAERPEALPEHLEAGIQSEIGTNAENRFGQRTGGWRQRFLQLREGNPRILRRRRHRRMLAEVTASGKPIREEVPFVTPDDAHIRLALEQKRRTA